MDIVMAINMGGTMSKPLIKMCSLPKSKGSCAAPAGGTVKSAGAPGGAILNQVHGLGV